MSDVSKIEWTDATWNPTTGCNDVSDGCTHCYARTLTERFHGKGSFDHVVLHTEKLELPLRWRKPRRVFVNSMSDLFHEQIPDGFIAQVFDVMAHADHHTFQVLTKRHARMRSLLRSPAFQSDVVPPHGWPIRNVWLGVSVEDQKWADIRIPALLTTPAAVRFVSAEPLLYPVALPGLIPEGMPGVCFDVAGQWWHVPGSCPHCRPVLDWVITGGESGAGARPMHPQWARSIRDQCREAGVAYFHKQNGEWHPAPPGRATHLLHDTGTLVTVADGSMRDPYGSGGGVQDLIDRGHRGWVRVRRVGKKAAGRVLDGVTYDEYPKGP